MTRISDATFAIVANGFADGPSQALRTHLEREGARRIVTISHPLLAEGDTRHEIEVRRPGVRPAVWRVALPCRPPYTYPLDLLVPPRSPRADGWFGFNGLACARGLAARARGRVDRVVYWCVDFVPERFGRGPLTRAYDVLDRLCCTRADARFELSESARDGRDARHRLPARRRAPAEVVPMGAWLDRVPTTDAGAAPSRRVVYLGHLVPRQGVGALVDAVALLTGRGRPVDLDVVGRGELGETLRRQARAAGIADRVHFHGFVRDHRDVERILAAASVAAAPYDTAGDSFTRFADPGKLKAYLAAGLPIVTTDVPPNAGVLARDGGAEVVPFGKEAIADAIERCLADPARWRARRGSALRLAREYDWPVILTRALASVGFVP